MTRVLPTAGIHNFRDYGGYRGDGGRVVTGQLWRSGQHAGAVAADLAAVDGLQLATVIDLRSDRERAAFPCRRGPGFEAEVLFEGSRGAPELSHLAAGGDIVSEADARAAMLRLYRRMGERRVLNAILTRYFMALAAGAGPSLVHCFAGKDRTGVAVALLHDALGVDWDDVVADYLLTNAAGDPEARIAAGAGHVREAYGARMSDAAVRVLMGVEAAFLEAWRASIIERWGSLAAFRAEVLGVDAATVTRLRAALVVG